MAESGFGGRFWFRAALARDARNATYKARISTSLWRRMHGEMRDVSRFRAFGCRAWVYLDADRREKGKHMARAVEAINLGNQSRIRTQDKRILLLNSGEEQLDDIESSEI